MLLKKYETVGSGAFPRACTFLNGSVAEKIIFISKYF